jgi:putative acetyltransferase
MIKIVSYSPEYLPAFIAYNTEWIETYFKVEPHDIEQLEQAEANIIAGGSQIYFAIEGEAILGTVALIKDSGSVFELAKMAVPPMHHGKGIGALLGQHVIAEAKKIGCRYLYLVSNRSLIPALTLYKKLGFVEVEVGETLYERANFKAEIWL